PDRSLTRLAAALSASSIWKKPVLRARKRAVSSRRFSGSRQIWLLQTGHRDTIVAGYHTRFPGRACNFATELGSIFVLRITAPRIQLRSNVSASDTPVVLGEDGKGANSGLDIAGDVEAFFAAGNLGLPGVLKIQVKNLLFRVL